MVVSCALVYMHGHHQPLTTHFLVQMILLTLNHSQHVVLLLDFQISGLTEFEFSLIAR